MSGSASGAACRAKAATREQQPRLAPARLAGWLDPAMVRVDAPLEESAADGEVRFAAPGLSLRLDPLHVRRHVTAASLLLVTGTPLLGGRTATAMELHAALERASFPSIRVGGRFAAVFLDFKRGQVLLVTDRFGVWPLCWARDSSRISFADRADSVPLQEAAQIDLQALFDYVYFHMIPAPRTVFAGVRRVPAAAALRISASDAQVAPAWEPSFAPPGRYAGEELAQRFRDAVREAVAFEAGGGNVGCFLSGGTDSSTVAGMLARVRGGAATFSIGFDAAGYDEMAYARITARHFGTDHHEYYVTPADLCAGIPRVAAHYDQPFGNSSAVPAYCCALLARDHGVEKLLAGDGGDELFGGNSRYAKQKIFEGWWGLPAPVRALLAPLADNALTRQLPLARKAASYVAQASVPMPARTETYNLLSRFGATYVLDPEVIAAVDQGAPPRLQTEVYARHADAQFVDRMLAYDWRFTLADNDLPKVTGTTQLAGVAVGFPLLADPIVDLSMELPANDKVRGLALRHFFKQALTGFLPAEIIAKKKHGFGLPVGPWLVKDAAFRRLAEDSIAGLAARRVIRPAMVDDLFSVRLEQHAGYYGEMVWVLMMLEQWLAAHAPDFRVA